MPQPPFPPRQGPAETSEGGFRITSNLTESRWGIISPEGEWTSNVYQDASNGMDPSEQLEVVVVVPNQEGVDFRQANTPAQLPFRCVALPSN